MFSKTIKNIVLGLGLLAPIHFATVQDAAAIGTVIKLGLGGTGPDVVFSSGIFSTMSDGIAGTTGDQNTDVDYVGDLAGLTDIINGASFTLSSVLANGALIVNGNLFNQITNGGTFSLWDTGNNLLISGVLADGVLSGSLASTSGSFFNTSFTSFTGGSLLSILATQPVSISLSLTGVATNGQAGFGKTCDGQSCYLNGFTGNATGLVDATVVPEPMSAALLLSGLVAGAGMRRRKQS